MQLLFSLHEIYSQDFGCARVKELLAFHLMNSVSNANFGLLIAYVIPGFGIVLGASNHYKWLAELLGQSHADSPSVAGVLLLTILAVSAGLLASTIRWLLLDTLHHQTGITNRSWKFDELKNGAEGIQFLVEAHYRYYQFYGNSLVALPVSMTFRWAASGLIWLELWGSMAICVLFFAATRDSLRKYYLRTAEVLRRNQ